MRNKTKNTIKEICWIILALIILLTIMIMTLIKINEHINFLENQFSDKNYDKCCGGIPCSDTYYSEEDNLCHLILCEQSFFSNKSNCVYKATK